MMNSEHAASFGLDNKQAQYSITMPIPPPPLPPIFPPPNMAPRNFSYTPTFLPQQFTDTSISPFPINTFQRNSIPSAPMWTAPSSSVKHQPSNVAKSQKKVNLWLKSKKIINNPTYIDKPNNMKIFQLKEKLNSAHNLIKEVQNGARTLNVMVKSVASFEWDQKCNEIEKKKQELFNILNELKWSKEELDQIKMKCLKRSKKRARLRRQALRRKAQKENDKVNTENLLFRIDNWQKEMQEEVERNKQEKELQQEADAVLWGVRQRKGEARHHLELLSTLQDLREARVQRRSAAGQSNSTLETETFSTVIGRLKELWSEYLSECKFEEQALRSMLAKSESTQDPVATYKKLVLQEWQVALFGPSPSKLETDFSLLETRRSWDQFVVDELTVLASNIPPGWVLPVPPSSHQWQSLLKY